MRRLILVIIFGLVAVTVANAQSVVSIRVTPSVIEEKMGPGDTLNFVLKVTNLGADTQTLFLIKRNIRQLREGGVPEFAEENEPTGLELTSWLKVADEPVIVKAGATKEIPLAIVIPKDAGPGGHFGGIFLSASPAKPKETGIGIGYQVGTIISLRVSGDIKEEARIREFRSDCLICGKAEVKFFAKVENAGNVLIRPRGPLEIIDFFGKKVATLTINEEGAAVLPAGLRQFESSWQGEGLALGHYTALLALNFGDTEKQTISEETAFWILPLKIIGPSAGIILILLLGLFVFVKLYIRRQLRHLQPARTAVSRQPSSLSRSSLLTITILLSTLLFFIIVFLFLAW